MPDERAAKTLKANCVLFSSIASGIKPVFILTLAILEQLRFPEFYCSTPKIKKMLRKDHFNGFKEFEQTVLQLRHDGVADGKKPEEFLNLAVAPSNVVKK